MNMEKIFGFTMEELAELFEPQDTFEHKVNEITEKECGMVTMVFNKCCKARYLAMIQNTIMESKLSKKDKEMLIMGIEAIISECFNAGRMDALEEYGDFEGCVKGTAEQRVKKWREKRKEE